MIVFCVNLSTIILTRQCLIRRHANGTTNIISIETFPNFSRKRTISRISRSPKTEKSPLLQRENLTCIQTESKQVNWAYFGAVAMEQRNSYLISRTESIHLVAQGYQLLWSYARGILIHCSQIFKYTKHVLDVKSNPRGRRDLLQIFGLFKNCWYFAGQLTSILLSPTSFKVHTQLWAKVNQPLHIPSYALIQ